MSYIFEGDSEDARRNRLSIIGGSNIAYNAVISVSFSGEAGTEPFDLTAAKEWLKASLDITEDDTLITALIKAARIACEKYANQSFITRTVTAKIHNGLGNFYLPYGPVVSVTSVKDGSITLTGFTIDDFAVPSDNDLVATYTAGYTTLPEDIKTAIKNQVSFMYEKRGSEEMTNGMSEMSKLILNPIRNV